MANLRVRGGGWAWRFGLLVGLAAVLACPRTAAASTCAELANLKLPAVTIDTASAHPGGPMPAPTLSVGHGKLAFAVSPADMPALCRVAGSIRPTADSDIRFELWLPAKNWNGRYVQVGNGGLAGAVPTYRFAALVRQGYAVAGTDDGHVADSNDGRWAVGHPEKIKDFADRAVHLTSVAGKAIAAAYYGVHPHHAYFTGCSEGGREALMEAQRFPQDFDGIAAGSAANDFTGTMAAILWNERAVTIPAAAAIPAALLPVIQAAARAQCDASDGLRDGVVDDPRRCRFDPAVLRCKPGARRGSCLTAAQVAALRKIYAGPRDPVTGRIISPGFESGGEAEEPLTLSGIHGKSPDTLQAHAYFGDLVFQDPAWDPRRFDFHRDMAAAAGVGALIDATDPDLRKFKAGGGKLIQFHGWLDGAVPPRQSVAYYERAVATMGGLAQTQDFYRLFLAPGMLHCGLGPGPNGFGQGFLEPFRHDPDHDILLALQAWVEAGRTPERLIATKFIDDDPASGVARQRPLCPYPATARYRGGDKRLSANYSCRAAKRPS